jgi:hypothetical protein
MVPLDDLDEHNKGERREQASTGKGRVGRGDTGRWCVVFRRFEDFIENFESVRHNVQKLYVSSYVLVKSTKYVGPTKQNNIQRTDYTLHTPTSTRFLSSSSKSANVQHCHNNN